MSGGAETVVVAFARAGFEMVLSSVKAANDAERLEIEQMLAETHAQLAAIPRLAPELDAITERHRARVRAKADAEGATAHKVEQRSTLPLVPVESATTWGTGVPRSLEESTALGWDGAPTEGEDPDQ